MCFMHCAINTQWFTGSITLVIILLTAQCTSAKRGVVVACRPSVCLSVTLVMYDHTGWKSWKLTARAISPTR